MMLSLITLLAGFSVGACRHSCHRHHGMTQEKLDMIQKHIAGKLDLNQDQKNKLTEIMKPLSEKLPEMNKTREKVSGVLIQQLESEKFNSEAFNAELESAEKDITGLRKQVVKAVTEFQAILNPEQKKKFVDLLKKHRAKMGFDGK